MKVKITNKASYSREIKLISTNQSVILSAKESVEIDNVVDSIELAYYNSLSCSGYDVEFSHSDLCQNDKAKDAEFNYAELSDEELKRIIKNLGISTRYRVREKLESIIKEALTEGDNPKNYL